MNFIFDTLCRLILFPNERLLLETDLRGRFRILLLPQVQLQLATLFVASIKWIKRLNEVVYPSTYICARVW